MENTDFNADSRTLIGSSCHNRKSVLDLRCIIAFYGQKCLKAVDVNIHFEAER